MHQTVEKLWIPPSAYDKQIAGLNYALREYDERLSFGRNEDRGDWCVFLIVRGEDPIAILGFQNTIPTREEMIARLDACNTKKQGDEIINSIERHNAELRRKLDEPVSEAAGEVAEAMESFLHAQDKTPYKRVYNKATESKRTGGTRGGR